MCIRDRDEQDNIDDWRDIIVIAAGAYHSVGLKKDGTVVAGGNNQYGQCEVGEWRNIKAIAAGGALTIGLQVDLSLIHICRITR